MGVWRGTRFFHLNRSSVMFHSQRFVSLLFFHKIEDHMGNKCFAEIFAKLINIFF